MRPDSASEPSTPRFAAPHVAQHKRGIIGMPIPLTISVGRGREIESLIALLVRGEAV